MTKTETPNLLVFSDDWGRHASSCQHLMRRFLPEHQVAWVNTIGLRRPKLDRVSLIRIAGKLRDWSVPANDSAELPENLQVANPKMWPYFRRSWDRSINRSLLLKQLAPVVKSMSGTTVAVTTVPIVADLMDGLPVDRWIYYCVDDFSKWPGLDHIAIDRMEEQLVRKADVVFAVSEKLQERIAGWGRASHLFTHGVDLERWTNGQATTIPPEIENAERPLVLFWGLIDWQMDLEFVRRLSQDMDQGTIVLVGPQADPDPKLFTIPRVVRVPQVPFDRLPGFAHQASVLVMPYIDAPGLRESQPLKLKEYLATGKPAVVRDLPANRAWADAFDLVATPEEFSSTVRHRLEHGIPADQIEARKRLDQESWQGKADFFREMGLDQVVEATLQTETPHGK